MIKQPKSEYTRQIKPNESQLRHLEKSTNWLSTIARNRINSYALNIPEESKKDFKSRFKNDFGATYFELVIHQIFYKQGFKLTEHPNVPGSSRRPDYLIETPNEKIYLECKEFKNLTDDEKKLDKIKKDVLYQLSILTSKYFLYNIEELTILKENIGDLSTEYNSIQSILNENPKDKVKDEHEYVHKKYEVINDCIRLRIEFSLKHDWKEEIEEDELLGTHTGNPIFGFSEKSLRKGLINKMTRYGKTNLPLIVSLNVSSHWYCKRLIFENMFYGSTWIRPQTDEDGREQNGIFTKPNNNLNHVAGALIFFAANPYGIEHTQYYYYENPNYQGKIKIMESLSNIKFVNSKIEFTEKMSLKELTE